MFRLIRGEYLKHKGREYVQAADAIGASNARRMFVHIFPNISHVVLVQLSILTVAFIKTEVILSFLGLGVPVDVVSWGSMLNEAQNELILGKWWQLAAAGTAMALLVTAFSLFTDALRDALDPKLKGADAGDECDRSRQLHRNRCFRVRNLRVNFRLDKQTALRGGQGHQLRHSAERHGRAGRRIGQRQVGDVARRSSACCRRKIRTC